MNLQSPVEHRYLSHYPNVLKDCKSEASKYVKYTISMITRPLYYIMCMHGGLDHETVIVVVAWFCPFFFRFAFESVVRSMLSVGFEEEEIVAVVALLAGVILIGDIVSQKIQLILY